eukprot:m.259660 g.259660  ORF g.259660 m.259660 type:complete len:496 (+) comp38456_c0_seq1:127-1614(+)
MADEDVMHVGWLIKAPPLKSVKQQSWGWRKRWFVMRRSMCRLSYYGSQDLTDCKGEIDLKFCEKVMINIDAGKKRNVFCLVFPTREYFLQAENEMEMIKWAHHLQEIFLGSTKTPATRKKANQPLANASAAPLQPDNGPDRNTASQGRQRLSTMPKPLRGPQCAPPPPPPQLGAATKTPEPAKTVPVKRTVPIWVHDSCSRPTAQRLLGGKPSGTFLVYPDSGEDYILAVATNVDGVIHLLLEKESDGVYLANENEYGQAAGLNSVIDVLHLPQDGWPQILGDFIPVAGASRDEIRGEQLRIVASKAEILEASEKHDEDVARMRKVSVQSMYDTTPSDEFDNNDDDNQERTPPLPEHWEQVLDPSTGEFYYFNNKTSVTSWERPVEKTTISEDTEEDVGDKGEWKIFVDETTGTKYFHNTTTGESSWEDPNKEKAVTRGKALYAYAPQKSDEVTLEEGMALIIVSPDDGSGWIKVELPSGDCGYVPQLYVEVIAN